MIVCHSRDTVAKLAKLQPSRNKASRIKARTSLGKLCQDVWWDAIVDGDDRKYGQEEEG
jgi:hypothetical protein